MINRIPQGYWYALAAVLIWTGFILVSRMGGISPLLPNDVIAIRYTTCALILLPVWWFKYRVNLLNPKLIICCLVGGLAYACCAFRGFKLAPASHAAVLLPGLMPLFITLLSRLLFKEHTSRRKMVGVSIITVGVLSLLWQDTSVDSVSIGHLWLILAALFWALFSVMLKHWSISAWDATIGLALITGAVYLPVYLLALPKAIVPSLWQDIAIQAFYQGFLATIVQMLLYVRAVHLIGPASMGTMMAIVPLLASFAAIALLDEPFGLALLFAAVLVSSGSWITQSNK